ncbi:hypothetical protein KAR91_36135 [Candidatus Pacearchaeota archaeon]|nr:hypothetical protein [Candidatus Pacearchaeota archaeon]
MSNLNKEKEYSNLTDALQFVFSQLLKNIFVSIPGIIESYDPEKKRCRVRPAINILLTDGSTMKQSAIVNVPVLWPSGGGFTLLSPLPEGTPVEIKFSQRGITKFKETFSQEDPGNGVLDKEDAHVIPSYGALEVTPGSLTGMCLQKNDGSIFICAENDKMKIKGDLEMIDGVITGPNVFNGSASDDHLHGGVTTGIDDTGVPK